MKFLSQSYVFTSKFLKNDVAWTIVNPFIIPAMYFLSRKQIHPIILATPSALFVLVYQ